MNTLVTKTSREKVYLHPKQITHELKKNVQEFLETNFANKYTNEGYIVSIREWRYLLNSDDHGNPLGLIKDQYVVYDVQVLFEMFIPVVGQCYNVRVKQVFPNGIDAVIPFAESHEIPIFVMPPNASAAAAASCDPEPGSIVTVRITSKQYYNKEITCGGELCVKESKRK